MKKATKLMKNSVSSPAYAPSLKHTSATRGTVRLGRFDGEDLQCADKELKH